MDYQAFIKASQKAQRAYIRKEFTRMQKARRLWNRYATGMLALGLHPLGRAELDDRERQLRGMSARVHETHGDSPSMRAAYDFHLARKLAA